MNNRNRAIFSNGNGDALNNILLRFEDLFIITLYLPPV